MTDVDHLAATRNFYDTIASEYADRVRDHLAATPVDRALLALFAELVQAQGNVRVADLGCGEGRITAHLSSLGLSAFGVDLSPKLVDLARAAYPQLRFEVAPMLDLEIPDGSVGGVVAWYSIIHTPTELLPEMFAAFYRMLSPGGHLLVAFQIGDAPLHLVRPFGYDVSLEFHRRQPDDITALLEAAGFDVRTRLQRAPEEGLENTPQAYLLARKPS
ncbi:MAG: methyltransferase domain-containing protein [Mycobacteriaceae bacterium]|nr:methyltransferase domain-containing protein [Mycobacteriaceae bacterium]